MKHFAAVTLTLLMSGSAPTAFAAAGPTDTVERHPTVVEMFDFDDNFGTLSRVASGVPRAKPNPFEEAIDRWRASAEAFTRGFAMNRGANGAESFRTRRVYEDEIGQAHVRLSQTIAGLPVVGSELIVHADFQTGRVLGVNGRFAIDRGLARSPRMNAGDAIAAAVNEYGLTTAKAVDTPELTYIIDGHHEVRLAWTNLFSYSGENGFELDRIYADALTGAAIARHPQVRRASNREVYDCLNQAPTSWGSCTFLFGEGGSSSDPKAMAAYNNAGIAYNYFSSRHGRDGMNNAGIVLRQAINYSIDNACCGGWFPMGAYSAIVYTDGQGSYSAPESYSLDVVGHEFTHGVVHYETFLAWDLYTNEQAAIEEGLADVFAVAIDAYRDGTPDWWIAEDIFTVNISGDALRYLDDPARRSGQVDQYPEREQGGAHVNAGIIGLAFYLLTEGGVHPRISGEFLPFVDAEGILRAEKIFYRAVATYMISDTNFRTLRDYTLQAADDLYGSQTTTNVSKTWENVGNAWYTHEQSLTANSQWISASYVSDRVGWHTGQYLGLGSFDVFLEKWEGSDWVVKAASPDNMYSLKKVEAWVSSGEFRWRVEASNNAGSFDLHTNRPF